MLVHGTSSNRSKVTPYDACGAPASFASEHVSRLPIRRAPLDHSHAVEARGTAGRGGTGRSYTRDIITCSCLHPGTVRRASWGKRWPPCTPDVPDVSSHPLHTERRAVCDIGCLCILFDLSLYRPDYRTSEAQARTGEGNS
ncbi:hypothetical protein Bbelb_057040 [Branchiostoma belcheri]|nr:hypothetical protein Bbelb_057040 [Branchiostoma belcheri]